MAEKFSSIIGDTLVSATNILLHDELLLAEKNLDDCCQENYIDFTKANLGMPFMIGIDPTAAMAEWEKEISESLAGKAVITAPLNLVKESDGQGGTTEALYMELYWGQGSFQASYAPACGSPDFNTCTIPTCTPLTDRYNTPELKVFRIDTDTRKIEMNICLNTFANIRGKNLYAQALERATSGQTKVSEEQLLAESIVNTAMIAVQRRKLQFTLLDDVLDMGVIARVVGVVSTSADEAVLRVTAPARFDVFLDEQLAIVRPATSNVDCYPVCAPSQKFRVMGVARMCGAPSMDEFTIKLQKDRDVVTGALIDLPTPEVGDLIMATVNEPMTLGANTVLEPYAGAPTVTVVNNYGGFTRCCLGQAGVYGAMRNAIEDQILGITNDTLMCNFKDVFKIKFYCCPYFDDEGNRIVTDLSLQTIETSLERAMMASRQLDKYVKENDQLSIFKNQKTIYIEAAPQTMKYLAQIAVGNLGEVQAVNNMNKNGQFEVLPTTKRYEMMFALPNDWTVELRTVTYEREEGEVLIGPRRRDGYFVFSTLGGDNSKFNAGAWVTQTPRDVFGGALVPANLKKMYENQFIFSDAGCNGSPDVWYLKMQMSQLKKSVALYYGGVTMFKNVYWQYPFECEPACKFWACDGVCVPNLNATALIPFSNSRSTQPS